VVTTRFTMQEVDHLRKETSKKATPDEAAKK
jgi:hypothetical protein